MQENKPTDWTRRGVLATGAAAMAAATLPARAAEGKIKIGQIGTRHPHAAGKWDAIRKLTDTYELVGIVEPDDAQWEKEQKRYEGAPRITEEKLFATAGLQAVAVETDIPDLVSTAQRCVDRELFIHLDKPAGLSLPDFRKLQDTAREKKVYVQMGYMLRYNPAFEFLYSAIEKGWLGEIFSVEGVMSKVSRGGGRAYLEDYAGGVMYELAGHIVDAVIAVLGKPDKVTPHLRKTFPEHDDVVDNTLAVFDYPKAIGTVRSSINEWGGNQRRQFVVCGTKGTVEIRPLEPPKMILTLEDSVEGYKKGRHEIEPPRATGRYDDEFRDLARIIRGENQPRYSAEHDLIVHEALLRAADMPLD